MGMSDLQLKWHKAMKQFGRIGEASYDFQKILYLGR